MRAVRALLCLVLAAGSVFCALVAGQGALSNLFEDYQDSPDSTYIGVGALFGALSVLLALGALAAAGKPKAAPATAAAVLVPVSALPYTWLVGTPGLAVHALVGLAALVFAARALS